MPPNAPAIRKDRPSGLNQVGTLNEAAGLSHNEYGFGGRRVTEFLFADFPLTITDSPAYVGTKIYTFPAVLLRMLDAAGSLTLTTTSAIASTLNAGVTVRWGLGSATASATTLATTMIDMLPGSGATPAAFTSSTVINVASAQDNDYLLHGDAQDAAAIWDGSSTPIECYFNVAIPTGTDIDADATTLLNGKIIAHWESVHDFSLLG